MERYLIVPAFGVPFLTIWYDYDQHYEQGMKVFDFRTMMFTSDGITWNQISRDQL